MKTIYKNLVESYEGILMMRETHIKMINTKAVVLKTLSLTFIMALIATATAILFKTTENLGYLFNILNMIVIGSFVIYKYLKGISFMTEFKLEYNIWISIFFDGLELLVYLSFTTLLIIMLLFLPFISYFLMIFYITIFIVFSLIYIYSIVELKRDGFFMQSYHQIIFGGIYALVLFYVLIVLSGIQNVALGIVFGYSVLSLIHFYKVLTVYYFLPIYKRRIFFYLFLLVFIMANEKIDRSDEVNHYNNIDYVANSIDTGIEYDKYLHDVVLTDENLYTYNNGTINIYDLNFDLLESIQVDGENAGLRQIGDDVVFYQRAITAVSPPNYMMLDLYNIVEEGSLIHYDTILVPKDYDFYPLDDHYVFPASYLYFYEENAAEQYKYVKYMSEYTDETIYVEESNYAILSYDNYGFIATETDSSSDDTETSFVPHTRYSNGHYIAYPSIHGELNQNIIRFGELEDLVSQESFINNSKAISLNIDATFTEFYYLEDCMYIISTNNDVDYISKLTHDGELIETFGFFNEMTDSSDNNYKLDVNNDYLVYTHDDSLMYIDLDDPYSLIFLGVPNNVTYTCWLLLIPLLFTTMPLPFFKGGELYV